jgi:hypothetical protein
MISSFLRVAVCVLAALHGTSALARAGSVTYVFQGTSGNETVNVQAVFTTSAGQLQIALSNLTTDANTVSVCQVITGLKFSVSGGGTASKLSGTQPIGGVDLSGTSPYQISNAGKSIADPNWSIINTGSGSTPIYLSVMGSGSPYEGIIGPGTSANSSTVTYAKLNGSLTGGPHNPFVYKEGDFLMDISGIDSTSTITSAYFEFNTCLDANFMQGSITNNPEPSSVTLLVIGAMGLGGFGWRRRNRNSRRQA